jgi:site-specific DNA-cytosine methylase
MLDDLLPREAPAPCGMQLAEFFCCAGGIGLGFRSAGFRLSFANDISKRAAASYALNLGHEPVVGDIRGVGAEHYGKLGEVDVVTGGFPCFPAGTLITTMRGLIPIEEVSVDDDVLTHRNRWRRASVLMSKDGASLVRVMMMGAPPIVTTPEHPFYVRKRTVIKGGLRSFGEPEWVEAKDLEKGHFFAQPIDAAGDGDAGLTEAQCYLIGRWLGDGWVVDHKRRSKVSAGQRGSRIKSRCRKAIICCANEEAGDLARRIAESGYHATAAAERTGVKFHISSRELVELFGEFGRYAHGKRVPEWVHRLPAGHKRKLWDGWFEADGSEGDIAASGTTVSERLAQGMARLARSVFGVAVSIMVVEKAATTVIEGRTVRQRMQYRVSVPRQNHEAFVEGGFAWVPFRGREELPSQHRVYNLEVEEDNSYVAGSVVVHNCVTFSTAGRRMGVVDDLNGKLYLELCRVIREIRPRYFVAENVEGMLSANGGKAVKLVLAEFLRLGYRTAFELVNMAEHGVPQTRKRVIFVGVRIDQWRGSFRFPQRTHRLREDKRASPMLPIAVSLAEAIGDLPQPGERIVGSTGGENGYILAAERRGEKISARSGQRPRAAREPSAVPTSTHPPHVVTSHARNDAPVSETHAMSKRLAHGNRPSPTIVSEATNVQPFIRAINAYSEKDIKRGRCSMTQAGDPSPTARSAHPPFVVAARNDDFQNPRRVSSSPAVTMTSSAAPEATLSDGTLRRMTVRECARVQSFPDWYEFAGSQADGYTVVGNAVPPLYARRLALAIRDYDARKIIP